MIEIFSRIENAFQSEDIGPCIPLPLGDEISSLSAILLNEDYYSMLLKEKNIVSGITVLSPVCLILFKAKAWLDLQERKTQGIHIDEKDIRKHKNDIMRLTSLLTGEERCELPEIVRLDMSLFIEKLSLEPVNLKSLNLPGVTFEDVLSVLKRIYLR